MTQAYVLDTGVLSAITHPAATPANVRCLEWLVNALGRGIVVVIPEIADYELRRELIRAGKTASVKKLNDAEKLLLYRPLTTAAMRIAAGLWADVRNRGLPTAPDDALDADVILAAQAQQLEREGYDVTVVTANVGHLSRLVAASKLGGLVMPLKPRRKMTQSMLQALSQIGELSVLLRLAMMTQHSKGRWQVFRNLGEVEHP